MRGKFITFEGGEGTGKSTQASLLALRLASLGIGVQLTREPGGSPGAEIIRHVLLSGAAKPLGPDAEAMLFAAARDDHVQQTILPALDAGKWVICDRFADSTRVYQGALGAVDLRFIRALERISIGDLKPDLTFVLDVPAQIGMKRAAGRRRGGTADRFEAEDIEFHEKLRKAYLALAAAENDRCVVMDAKAPKKMVAQRIWDAVREKLEPGRAPAELETAAHEPQATEPDEASLPSATSAFCGNAGTEAALLAAYRSRRVPHAFLLIGQKGIGKATLAYRFARFVLAHPDPAAPEVQCATSLAVEAAHPVARRMAARAQGDLLILERTPNDKGVLRQQIAVEDIRRTIGFFGSTAREGGWRIAIVDAVDELNRFGANALLKVLEEPPERTLLLLVCHSAARVLPTLRSRCSVMTMRPLEQTDVAAALAAAIGRSASDPEIEAAAAAADGSVARALTFLDADALALRQQALDQLDRLPAINPGALHALGDALAGVDPQPLAAFVDTVNVWLSQRLDRGKDDLAHLAQLAGAWQRINQAAQDAAEYNLERKPLVFSVFGFLAEATRG